MTFGVHNYTVWSDIEVDIGADETLRDVVNCYYKWATVASKARRERRSRSVWDALDRITKPLPGFEGSVKLVVKNTIVSGLKQYVVEISIV